jgi:hypothetical protein
MGHALLPKSGTFHSPETVIELLAREFAHVRVDRERAMGELRRHIHWIENANPSIFLGRHPEALAQAEKLKRAQSEDVLWIEFGDNPICCRSLVLWPGSSVSFGYADDNDERLARPILERCAAALQCELQPF